MSLPKFKSGDTVHWTNDYGVDLGERPVRGMEPNKFSNRYMIRPDDAHWMLCARGKSQASDGLRQSGVREFLIGGV